ncbi:MULTISPECIES: nucleotidyltransferase domain-containing protein [unclassified Lentimicrobium]|uniref:nucleotidyltransferase domain-containing protein n=1 Tax=unclassified Lentimicrobium TaxID=2677434 RepID=UPI001557BA3C|nr:MULTISPECIES: nucleotidyltransferase domain-containing protein [unclassified Lentimicrobium]NPD46148.1 nucleotidyltransferase domain-containing protein [Lentimicrobium sp. S6]NPD86294.1 nucleotidyltransferase domain-containing protein [Lentimicrobium sp. L6]
MKFGLKKDTIDLICSVFEKHTPLEKVIVYGSRAKGNYRNGSDIDLSCFGYDLTLTILHQIENDIDDLLLPYSFDISIFSHISNESLKEHIERVGQVFYEAKRN